MVKRDPAGLDAAFAAMAHPIRRSILERLAGGDATVTELAEPHGVSLPAISKHLKVLGKAGLITVEPEWRVRRCSLDVRPMQEAFGWLTRYRVFWEDRLDRLAEHVESENQPKKRKRNR